MTYNYFQKLAQQQKIAELLSMGFTPEMIKNAGSMESLQFGAQQAGSAILATMREQQARALAYQKAQAQEAQAQAEAEAVQNQRLMYGGIGGAGGAAIGAGAGALMGLNPWITGAAGGALGLAGGAMSPEIMKQYHSMMAQNQNEVPEGAETKENKEAALREAFIHGYAQPMGKQASVLDTIGQGLSDAGNAYWDAMVDLNAPKHLATSYNAIKDVARDAGNAYWDAMEDLNAPKHLATSYNAIKDFANQGVTKAQGWARDILGPTEEELQADQDIKFQIDAIEGAKREQAYNQAVQNQRLMYGGIGGAGGAAIGAGAGALMGLNPWLTGAAGGALGLAGGAMSPELLGGPDMAQFNDMIPGQVAEEPQLQSIPENKEAALRAAFLDGYFS